ncbi:carboxypeptidase-like regulatory domain-containing protein [Crateriforma conspicua]|uniref:Cna protein B-type domain protein n=1 Tax=Crateriforma conspicua TaxID=2527996 RepID=A0A5C5Y5C0_9PLAN|nr:carboxypeptidase-like regulatory domain-containing protein [Crateriforma conspicua]QDV64721.1 hypothetical protein Mal65_38840 [Crateriforma conspicua]TWT70118.1 hypothetical protein Pan14r_24180 [Crateriforma conspicua]
MKSASLAVGAALLFCSSVFAQGSGLRQWVRLTDDGRLQGEVMIPQNGNIDQAVSRADVRLVDVNGRVWEAKSSTKGRFTLRDVPPGAYALSARGENVWGIAAVHVIASDASDSAVYPTTAALSVASIDRALVQQAVGRYVSAASTGQDPMASVDLTRLSKQVAAGVSSRVRRIEGKLHGRVYLPGAVGDKLMPAVDTNIFIFREGAEAARAVTDLDGKFEIEELPPAAYALVAARSTGVAVVGFELVDGSDKQARSSASSKKQLVSYFAEPIADELVVQLAPPGTIDPVVDTSDDGPSDGTEDAIEDEVVEEGFGSALTIPPGTYIAPSGAGGGGGFVGGGGELIGLAAIAAIAAASDDNDNNQPFVPVPPPVSPASP